MGHYDRTDKSDHPKCNYCGSADPKDGFTVKEVIHRGRDPYTNRACVDHTKFTVCKGTDCGGKLQMGFEG